MSHKNDILAHLKRGKTITPLEALQLYGCMRLAARIDDLKNDGWRILSYRKHLAHGKKVAEYILMKPARAGK